MAGMSWSEIFNYVRTDALINWFTGWLREVDLIFWSILVVWFLEWAVVVEYFLGEYYRTFVIFPIRIPLILTLSILYWCYLWGMSGWRRTQFGRFTRGDRKLWAKGYTAF